MKFRRMSCPFATPAHWSMRTVSPKAAFTSSTTMIALSAVETAKKSDETFSGYLVGSMKVTEMSPFFRL